MGVGSFFPSLLEPRRRVDKARWGVIMTDYSTGTSFSVVRLVGSVLRGQHDDWTIAERSFLSEQSMAQIVTSPEDTTTNDTLELPAADPRPVELARTLTSTTRRGAACDCRQVAPTVASAV